MSKKKTEEEQFRYRVDANTGCWLWTGPLDSEKYGRIRCDVGGKRKRLLAHRYSYTKLVGDIPLNLLVCHRCDNPSCINPEHLFLGTQADNMKDMGVKKRARSSKIMKCPKGHDYDRVSHYATGIRRICGACKNEQMRRRRKAKVKKDTIDAAILSD